MWKKVMLVFFLLISAAAGFGVAKVESMVTNTLSQVQRDTDSVFKDIDLEGIQVESDDEIVNLLLVGTDYRVDGNYTGSDLADVMMIATMDKKHHSLKLTSLMRDTWLEMTDGSQSRLNSAMNDCYNGGGIKNLYKTIAKNYNIKLDGYASVGFDAFVKVVNAVGGVEAELTESEANYLNTTNYIRAKKHRDVKPGKQTLNGAQALGYCRIRKGGGAETINGLRDDYGRTWRQRTVMSGIFDKIKTMPKTELIDLANKVLGDVKTDLDNDSIMDYIVDVISMGTLEIKQLQIPYNGYFFDTGRNSPIYKDYVLVPYDGVNRTLDTSVNTKILHQFIFKYDGEGEFTYQPPEGAADTAQPSGQE